MNDSLEKIPRILVVDDTAAIRDLMQIILSTLPAEVLQASSGQEATEKLLGTTEQPATKFDLVLMDLLMPKMDGYTTTQNLRDAGYSGIIVALTAFANEETHGDRKNLFTEFLTKPISLEKVREILSTNGPT